MMRPGGIFDVKPAEWAMRWPALARTFGASRHGPQTLRSMRSGDREGLQLNAVARSEPRSGRVHRR